MRTACGTTKDGKSYYFVGEGSSAKGNWVRLMFRDGSRTFFAERETVEITKRYRGEMSIRRLQSFAEDRKREDRGEFRNGGKCRERGCSSIAVDRGYCRQCAFDEFDD